MVSFGHTAVGVVVGVTVYQFLGSHDLLSGLVATGTVGIASHYIMDAIPHGHFKMVGGYKKGVLPIIVFDLFLSIILFLGTIYLQEGFSQRFLYTLFGIGGSQLPDVIDGLIYTDVLKAKGFLKIENNIHEGMHWHGTGKKTLPLGIRDIWQISVVAVALYILLFNVNIKLWMI